MDASDTPRFSILLPTHDQVELLKLALASVLYQTRPDFEVLVVADGCTDGTQDAVRALDDPRIRLFDLPKAPGFGYANRNIALHQARGELIAFLGHDNLYFPDHLELMDAAFEDPAVEWAHSRPVYVEADGRAWPTSVNLAAPRIFESYLEGKTHLPASPVVHRRSCLEKYGYWDETRGRGGDWVLWRKIITEARGANLAFVDPPTTLHFRAHWRTFLRQRNPGFELCFGAYLDDWPLSVVVPNGCTEQEVYWRLMSADPEGWSLRFRHNARVILDTARQDRELKLLAKRKNKRRRLALDAGAPFWRWLRRRLGLKPRA